MMIEVEARRALVEGGLRLLAEGLVARTWGNLSLRLAADSMAITPSGIPYADLTEEMIALVDLRTGQWAGRWKPSGERGVHRSIYLRRPDVGAIVHTHQCAGSACAAARVAVPAPWGETPCATYKLPGTAALASAVAHAIGSGPAALMEKHGAVVIGPDLESVFGRIRTLERACADFLAAKAPAPLPARVDAPWEPSWLEPLSLDDGSPALLSRAPFTLAWAARGLALRAALDDLAQLAGTGVPSSPGLPPRPPKNGALLVTGLGLVACGTDAEALAMVVEKAARAALGCEALGGAHPIPAWEALLMRAVYKGSYARQAGAARLKPAGGD